MGAPNSDQRMSDTDLLQGFSPTSPTKIHWNSRKKSADGQKMDKATEESSKTPSEEPPVTQSEPQDTTPALSERRKALFEPLEPTRKRSSAEMLLPPPDFDNAAYPKGWLVGKKRKLVNVDVVESMRRIAVQEMNRKDREIDGLNEQLEADARCLEHLQLQLLDERSKRAEVERQNAMLQNQISMLMTMLQDNEEDDAPSDDS